MSGWPAPAKLNLFLKVTGRRPDGYHTLQTVFQFLDYGDALDFKIRDDGEIVRSEEIEQVSEKDDLSIKAAKLLQVHAGCSLGVEITLRKKIPIGGGLGGGSSDAATTLVVLNHLWQTHLSRSNLAAIGLQLGADVPVFIHGNAAWAEGVGDKLTPINPEESFYIVVSPRVAVSTAKIFANHKLTPLDHPIRIRDFHSHQLGNELESTVCAIYPEVRGALSWLRQFGQAQMTGTGASVFLSVKDRQLGEEILTQRPSDFHGFVAQGVNTHPLKII